MRASTMIELSRRWQYHTWDRYADDDPRRVPMLETMTERVQRMSQDGEHAELEELSAAAHLLGNRIVAHNIYGPALVFGPGDGTETLNILWDGTNHFDALFPACEYPTEGPETMLNIHQVFLDVGHGGLEQYRHGTLYMRNAVALKTLYPHTYTLWLDPDVDKLFAKYPQFQPLVASFPHPFYRVDFAKMLILYDTPGCNLYVDMDEEPLYVSRGLPTPITGMCHGVQRDGRPNNNILYFSCRAHIWSLLLHCALRWGRILCQPLLCSVGSVMLQEWLHRHQVVNSIQMTQYFRSHSTHAWLTVHRHLRLTTHRHLQARGARRASAPATAASRTTSMKKPAAHAVSEGSLEQRPASRWQKYRRSTGHHRGHQTSAQQSKERRARDKQKTGKSSRGGKTTGAHRQRAKCNVRVKLVRDLWKRFVDSGSAAPAKDAVFAEERNLAWALVFVCSIWVRFLNEQGEGVHSNSFHSVSSYLLPICHKGENRERSYVYACFVLQESMSRNRHT